MAAHSSIFPHSNVLVLASDSIQSLLPTTLISQVEALLESHKIEDAAELADQQKKKFQTRVIVDEEEAEELHYVYQRIGFRCLFETRFEDAGRHLFSGNVDPRIIVSYFPDLRGSLFSAEDSVNMFSGVVDHMPKAVSIDDIIVENIVRNYSPHLAPDTQSAPPTAELRRILHATATNMLETFLNQWRANRRIGSIAVTPELEKINAVVDTIHAKLFAMAEKTTMLYVLIDEPNNIIVEEVDPVLIQHGQYNALCKIYRQRGDHERLLTILSKLVDGEWTDDDIPDPLTEIFNLLTEKRDRVLIQRWANWLIKQDHQRALKLLTAREINKRNRIEDDLALLEQIRDAHPEAGSQFLEYLVLQKKVNNAQLHRELASSCLDHLLTFLQDDSVSKLWRAKAASYRTSRSQTSFLSYFASTTPDSEHKRLRLKTIFFLQCAPHIDHQAIHSRLIEHQKILQLEVAIIEGKLGNHRPALSILVDGLQDEVSAETYCTLGGSIVPPKVAQSIGESNDLQQWASLLVQGNKAKSLPKSTDEGVQKELLMALLEVYMSSGQLSSTERTARLLNTQAMNLSVLEVIPLVPPDWPLSTMSSFLSRSFRQTLHKRHEGQIVKAISTGQNLEVADKAWVILREQGAIIEEPLDDDGEFQEKKPLPHLPSETIRGEAFDEKDGGFLEPSDGVVEIHGSG